jgi:two-component system chemotaxis response regulator CheB
MRTAFEEAFTDSKFILSRNLTDAYHVIEHEIPDCVVLASDFGHNADFEMLSALLRIVGVGAVWWRSSQRALQPDDLYAIRTIGLDSGLPFLRETVKNATGGPLDYQQPLAAPPRTHNHDPKRIVLIGASTGGVDALTKTLRHFSQITPPTLIVQHTGGRFAQSLIRLLNSVTTASVVAAEDGMTLKQGEVYLSPSAEYHLCLSTTSPLKITLANAHEMSGHRPSVDALFRSAVPYARHVTAALLTGMGKDGAEGLRALFLAGAHTIAQDQETSVVYGMPRVAAEMGAVVEHLPIEKIGAALLSSSKHRAQV